MLPDFFLPHALSLLDHPPGRALDVGSGRGRNSLYLAAQHGWKVVALDPSVRRLKEAGDTAASEGVRLEVVLGVGERLPVKPEAFDLVLCTHVLESMGLDAARHVVGELQRVLAPGGYLFLETAATDDGRSLVKTEGLPFHLYGEEELLAMLSGFKLVELLHLRLAQPQSAPPSAHWVYLGRRRS